MAGSRIAAEMRSDTKLCGHLKPFFGNRRMASITTADIREYNASRQKETTVARKAYSFTASGIPERVAMQMTGHKRRGACLSDTIS